MKHKTSAAKPGPIRLDNERGIVTHDGMNSMAWPAHFSQADWNATQAVLSSHANLVAALEAFVTLYDQGQLIIEGDDQTPAQDPVLLNARAALKSAQPHAATSPASKWEDNAIQFPRLIEEAQAAGAFTPEVLAAMGESMDLRLDGIRDILERARVKHEADKAVL